MPSTVFPIPAIADMTEGTLRRMRKCSEQNSLNIQANVVAPGFSPAPIVFGNRNCEGWRLDEPGGAGLKPAATKESFWVNIIGRRYPPPNRPFRWCTERLKIDAVNAMVKQHVGQWGEAILHFWPVFRLTNRRAGVYARLEIFSPSDQPQGLRRGFAFMGN